MKIAIAAIDPNRLIGDNNRIPWHIPDDFKWFKQATMGHILVMGRKTYASIGKPLPGRETFIYTRTPAKENEISNLSQIPSNEKIIWICGGGEVYRALLPSCNELILSHIKNTYTGNIYFPEYTDNFIYQETLKDHVDFTVKRYTKKEINVQ